VLDREHHFSVVNDKRVAAAALAWLLANAITFPPNVSATRDAQVVVAG